MARLQENFEAVYAENADEADFTDYPRRPVYISVLCLCPSGTSFFHTHAVYGCSSGNSIVLYLRIFKVGYS